jgi:hypothetical protein
MGSNEMVFIEEIYLETFILLRKDEDYGERVAGVLCNKGRCPPDGSERKHVTLGFSVDKNSNNLVWDMNKGDGCLRLHFHHP